MFPWSISIEHGNIMPFLHAYILPGNCNRWKIMSSANNGVHWCDSTHPFPIISIIHKRRLKLLYMDGKKNRMDKQWLLDRYYIRLVRFSVEWINAAWLAGPYIIFTTVLLTCVCHIRVTFRLHSSNSISPITSQTSMWHAYTDTVCNLTEKYFFLFPHKETDV